jgi:hypothetical protein
MRSSVSIKHTDSERICAADGAIRKRFRFRRGRMSNKLILEGKIGGRGRARTGDPLLAKQVLSQLSYTPTGKNDILIFGGIAGGVKLRGYGRCRAVKDSLMDGAGPRLRHAPAFCPDRCGKRSGRWK